MGFFWLERFVGFLNKQNSLVRFFVYGSGEEEKRLKELNHNLGLDSIVLFMGITKNPQAVFSKLDLAVLTSLWEGLPLMPIEAFSSGKAVVATNIPGNNDLVIDGYNGLLANPGDYNDIANKINTLISNDCLLKKMCSNALATYNNEYSYERFSQRIIEFYKSNILKHE